MTRYENVPQQYQQDNRSCGTRDVLEIAVSGITGLVVGAALMYLFDPETGADRRQRIAHTASSALESTTGTLSSAAGGVSDYVSDLGSRITGSGSWSDVADDYRGRIGSTFGAARKAIAPYVSAKARRGYLSSARSSYRDASRSASRYMPRLRFGEDKGISGTTATLGAFGALALGCAAMYLFDPRQGRARRAYLMDKATHWVRETGQLARATGRHLANRSRGLASEARSMMSSGEVDDRTLEARIRSELGRFGNVSNLDVSVIGGNVTLRGQCNESDIAKMTQAAESVRGVQRVQCELCGYDTGASVAAPSPQGINPTAM